MNRILRMSRMIQVYYNRRKSKFQIVIENRFPRIKVAEKNERTAKYFIRGIALAGIITSVISFSEWYYSLGTAITLYILSQIFEGMIFTYSVMMVQPMPEKWNSSNWTMMVVGMYDEKYVLGFGFDNHIVANDFFDTIYNWNDC